MQIEISDTIVMVALVWYLVWTGSERIIGLWFAIQENRRREREEVRRDGDVVRHEHEEARREREEARREGRDRRDRDAPRSWLGGRVEIEKKDGVSDE